MRDAPQELVDHVVALVQDDRPTLCSIRLVSRSWNISARVHLFRSLDLPVADRKTCSISSSPSLSTPIPIKRSGLDRLNRVLDILETSPDVGRCVREVFLTKASHNPASPTSADHEAYSLSLAVILAHLPRVTTLHLRELSWAQLPPALAHAVAQLLQLPTLTHLDIWNCEVPSAEALLGLLDRSYALSTLRLSHIRVTGPTSASGTSREPEDLAGPALPPCIRKTEPPCLSPPARKPLQHVTLESVPLALFLQALNRPGNMLDPSQVQRLSLFHLNDVSSVMCLLQLAGGALEHLELRVGSCRISLPSSHPLNLLHTPHLKTLRISGLQWTSNLCPAESLQTLLNPPSNTTSSPCSASELETIHLTINAIRRPSEPVLDARRWAVLCDTLCHAEFRGLKRLELRVMCMRLADVDQDVLEEAFGALKATGRLCIELQVF